MMGEARARVALGGRDGLPRLGGQRAEGRAEAVGLGGDGERSRDAIRPVGDPGARYWQSSGHEGDFVSVRRQFAWTAGSALAPEPADLKSSLAGGYGATGAATWTAVPTVWTGVQ